MRFNIVKVTCPICGHLLILLSDNGEEKVNELRIMLLRGDHLFFDCEKSVFGRFRQHEYCAMRNIRRYHG